MHESVCIRLATFHQKILSIQDQILHLRLLFDSLGFRFTVAESLDPTALNLMLEDFRPSSCQTIERFQRETGKRIAIVATEHLDYRDGHIYAYGEPLFIPEDNREYVTHQERARRLAGMMQASHSSRMILTLGDYPRLEGIEELFPRTPVLQLPFPPLPMDAVARRVNRRPIYDFVFTGSVTPFRSQILREIGIEFSIAMTQMGQNFIERARLYLQSSVALNIPQYPGWSWSSPMRILYGLVMGRLTISLLLEPASEIDRFTFTCSELSAAYLHEMLAELTPTRVLEKIEKYQQFARDSARKLQVDKTFMDWALVEGLV